MWSVVCAVVLWIINGALNLAAGSYTSFFINLFYVICLLTLCGAELRHAAAESNIHRHYAGEERARYCRNQEGSCDGCTDGDSH